MKKLLYRRAFWIIQVLSFLAFAAFSFHFYPKTFPVVDLKIQMDRLGALEKASHLAAEQKWGPHGFRQAATFNQESQTQTFIELAAGGSAAFSEVLKQGIYHPFTWKIRHFAEGQTNETWIQFTPAGDFYGFYEKLPEDAPGAAIEDEVARNIAESTATERWKIPLSEYKRVETSKETLPGKRVDHTFVYERIKEQIGDGRYRLRLVVGGDRLTELTHFVKIPDAFNRKYAEMRSANNTISSISSTAMTLLYLLAGCGFGLFILARRRAVLIKVPLLAAAAVAGCQFLERINTLPLAWLRYDTALSANTFLFEQIIYGLIGAFSDFALLAYSFMAAESLTRCAFPHHPQFWKLWKAPNASSFQVLGRTVAGYLSVGFFFAVVVCTYWVGLRYLGWWTPSDTLFHPDGLATYLPWFTSIANSLHAGFWEECLFRAVPLASAALLARRFGKPKYWIITGFALQALIFASAHANYAAQPSYARVLELIFPSLIFGGIYWYFGLLPGIILHYTFDVISFSLPLFTSEARSIWVDRILVILVSLIPLWIVLWQRIKQGRWSTLPQSEMNEGWSAAPRSTAGEELRVEPAELDHLPPLPRARAHLIIGAGILATLLILWEYRFFLPRSPQAAPIAPMLQLTRQEAIAVAIRQLPPNVQIDGVLQGSWKALAHPASSVSDEDRFVWQTSGAATFRSLNGSYLEPPHWSVRFVRFDIDVNERAEEYQVYLMDNGKVYRVRHNLPENRSGDQLERPEASQIAVKYLHDFFHYKEDQFSEVSADSSQLPNRRDWIFTYKDLQVATAEHPLKEGEARFAARISGSEPASSRRWIHVPEEWARKDRNKRNMSQVLSVVSVVIGILTFAAILIAAFVHWSKHEFRTKSFLALGTGLLSLQILGTLNELPFHFSQFDTKEPVTNQIIELLTRSTLTSFVPSLLLAFGAVYLSERIRQRKARTTRLERSASFAFGIVCVALMEIVFLATGSLTPPDTEVSQLGGFFPLLSTLGIVMGYLSYTNLALFMMMLIQKNSFYALLYGFFIAGLRAEDWVRTGLSGILASFLLWILAKKIVRTHYSLTPWVTAGWLCFSTFRSTYYSAVPMSWTYQVLQVLMVLIVCGIWTRKLGNTVAPS